MIDCEILCRFCSKFLCHASDLRKRDPNFILIPPKNYEKVTVNRSSFKLNCANANCCHELGVLVIFSRGSIPEVYVFQIKAIKFKFPDGIQEFNQWKKVPLHIKEIDF